jgi:hypothetical protein
VLAQFKPEHWRNNTLGSLSIFDLSNDYRMSDPARKASNSEKPEQEERIRTFK